MFMNTGLLEGSFRGRPVTKWAEEYPWDLADRMIQILFRIEIQDRNQSKGEEAINPSAAAEED